MANNDIFDFGGASEKKTEDEAPQPQAFSVMNEVEGFEKEDQLKAQDEQKGPETPSPEGNASAAPKPSGVAALLQNKIALASIAFFALIVAFIIFRTFVYQPSAPMEPDMLGQAPDQSGGSEVFQGDNSLPPGMAGEPVAIPQAMMEPGAVDPSMQYGMGAPTGIPEDMQVFAQGNPGSTPPADSYNAQPQGQPQAVVEAAPAQIVAEAQTAPPVSEIQADPTSQPMVAPESQSEITELKRKIEEKDARIKSLQSQLAASKREYTKLAGVSKKLLAKEKEMVAYSKESSGSTGKAAPVKASSVSSAYSIKAIVEGLAWLNTSDGRVITVRSGDTLAKNVSVISIDPVKMIVRTNAGEIN